MLKEKIISLEKKKKKSFTGSIWVPDRRNAYKQRQQTDKTY